MRRGCLQPVWGDGQAYGGNSKHKLKNRRDRNCPRQSTGAGMKQGQEGSRPYKFRIDSNAPDFRLRRERQTAPQGGNEVDGSGYRSVNWEPVVRILAVGDPPFPFPILHAATPDRKSRIGHSGSVRILNHAHTSDLISSQATEQAGWDTRYPEMMYTIDCRKMYTPL